jgi:hypothetical protein
VFFFGSIYSLVVVSWHLIRKKEVKNEIIPIQGSRCDGLKPLSPVAPTAAIADFADFVLLLLLFWHVEVTWDVPVCGHWTCRDGA